MKKKNAELKQLYTRWGKEPDPGSVLPEYPRPQLRRDTWYNLNGIWEYEITEAGSRPKGKREKILVPFSPESALSGAGVQLLPEEWLWYHRTWRKESGPGESSCACRYFLHFGAVDQCCAVYINGKKAAVHRGGYTPFSVEMTELLEDGDNRIAVCVRDVSDTSWYARGKQKRKRGGMYYTAQSGIWQTVWIEKVPESFVESVSVKADPDSGDISFRASVRAAAVREGMQGNMPGNAAQKQKAGERGADAGPVVKIFAPDQYAEREFTPGGKNVIAEFFTGAPEKAEKCGRGERLTYSASAKLPDLRAWSPEEPWLYYYQIIYENDTVTGYFAARTFSVENDGAGTPRFCLNHRPYFLKGVLDQGYWPDGLYTAPSDEAFVFDIREMKKTGFNMARKHAKVEADRWYYHCDRLGMIVWQDIVNGGTPYKDWFVTYLATWLGRNGTTVSDSRRKLFSREDAAGRIQFEKEMDETVRALKEHPCIAAWTLFNEGWGQFDTVRLTEKLKKEDPERTVDSASGWFDQGCGDYISIHHYFFRLPWRTDGKRAVVLSEIGGYAMHDDAHSACENVYGYKMFEDAESLGENVRALLREREQMEAQGLCGYVYTQWSDIEEEVNGIFTYDREIRKIENI